MTKNGLKQVCKDGPVFEMRDIDWEEKLDFVIPSRIKAF